MYLGGVTGCRAGTADLEPPGEISAAPGRFGLNGVGRPGVEAPNSVAEPMGPEDGAVTGVAALLA